MFLLYLRKHKLNIFVPPPERGRGCQKQQLCPEIEQTVLSPFPVLYDEFSGKCCNDFNDSEPKTDRGTLLIFTSSLLVVFAVVLIEMEGLISVFEVMEALAQTACSSSPPGYRVGLVRLPAVLTLKMETPLIIAVPHGDIASLYVAGEE